MEESNISPNTFIIGVQKSATTSLYNWIGQHKDVCAPSSLKDFPFFIKEDLYGQGVSSLAPEYKKFGYSSEKVVLQGNVQYVFFKKAIERLYDHDKNGKLILVLRNPVDRAISAYNYFKKLNIETLSLEDALKKEKDRLNGSYQEICDFTYTAHGMYYEQVKNILEYFPGEQLLVLLYTDIKNNPEETIKRVYEFLDIDPDFKPEFKKLNITGKVRFKWLQNAVFNQNKIKKKVVKALDPIVPIHLRTKIRWKIKELNTIKNSENTKGNSEKEKELFKSLFTEDVQKTGKLLNMDLSHWKL